MYKHILVATDGSRLSGKAVRAAVDLAKALGARLTAFYAAPDVPHVYGGEGYLYAPQASRADFIRGRDELVVKLLEAVKKRGDEAGVAVEIEHTVSNVPFEAILKTANRRKCDLIVMASHGRRGVSAILLGSETQKVITHSKVPVLVVR